MKNNRKPMLKMNNAFIFIFGSTPPPASYLATKRDAVRFPKSVNSFSGASPIACQKNFEKNRLRGLILPDLRLTKMLK